MRLRIGYLLDQAANKKPEVLKKKAADFYDFTLFSLSCRRKSVILQPNSRTELRQTPERNCAKLPNMSCKLLYGRKLLNQNKE